MRGILFLHLLVITHGLQPIHLPHLSIHPNQVKDEVDLERHEDQAFFRYLHTHIHEVEGKHLWMVQVDATIFDVSTFRSQTNCTTYPRFEGHSFACHATHIPHVIGVRWFDQYRPEYKFEEEKLHGRTAVKIIILPHSAAHTRSVILAHDSTLHVTIVSNELLLVAKNPLYGFITRLSHRETLPAHILPLSLIHWISEQPEVLWIQADPQHRPHNHYLREYFYGAEGTAAIPPDCGGEVITIGDTGCDTHHCLFADDTVDIPTLTLALQPFQTPSLTNNSQDHRKIMSYVRYDFTLDEENSIQTDFEDFQNGHGSHVMGTAVGEGPSHFQGVSRGTKLIVLDFGFGLEGGDYLYLPQDLETHVLEWLYRSTPSRIFSISWGSDVNAYSDIARQIDHFMSTHDDFIIIAAVGNTGDEGRGSVGTPATAKNLIAVGSSFQSTTAFEGYRDESLWVDEGNWPYDQGHIARHPALYNTSSLAYFSSSGPTSDGRIKPDILAPGSPVVSAQAHSECSHMVRHGTSMSAPAVAGMVAHLRTRLDHPSSALIKAMLIQVATPVHYKAGYDRYDGTLRAVILSQEPTMYEQGFGVTKVPKELPWWIDRHDIEMNDIHVYCLKEPGTATLTWIDPVAPWNARKQLMRDLNLIGIHDDGSILYSNGGVTPDYLNNVEKIRGVRVFLVVGDAFATHPYALTLSASPSGTCVELPTLEWVCRVPSGWGVRTYDPFTGKSTTCVTMDCEDPYVLRDNECIFTPQCHDECPIPHGIGIRCGEQCELVRCHPGYWVVDNQCVCRESVPCGVHGGTACVLTHCYEHFHLEDGKCILLETSDQSSTEATLMVLFILFIGFIFLAGSYMWFPPSLPTMSVRRKTTKKAKATRVARGMSFRRIHGI